MKEVVKYNEEERTLVRYLVEYEDMSELYESDGESSHLTSYPLELIDGEAGFMLREKGQDILLIKPEEMYALIPLFLALDAARRDSKGIGHLGKFKLYKVEPKGGME